MDPMIFWITLGGAIALLLSVVSAAAPVATRKILPLGGSEFKQTAIVLLSAIAIATVVNLLGTQSQIGTDTDASGQDQKVE